MVTFRQRGQSGRDLTAPRHLPGSDPEHGDRADALVVERSNLDRGAVILTTEGALDLGSQLQARQRAAGQAGQPWQPWQQRQPRHRAP